MVISSGCAYWANLGGGIQSGGLEGPNWEHEKKKKNRDLGRVRVHIAHVEGKKMREE